MRPRDVVKQNASGQLTASVGNMCPRDVVKQNASGQLTASVGNMCLKDVVMTTFRDDAYIEFHEDLSSLCVVPAVLCQTPKHNTELIH